MCTGTRRGHPTVTHPHTGGRSRPERPDTLAAPPVLSPGSRHCRPCPLRAARVTLHKTGSDFSVNMVVFRLSQGTFKVFSAEGTDKNANDWPVLHLKVSPSSRDYVINQMITSHLLETSKITYIFQCLQKDFDVYNWHSGHYVVFHEIPEFE